MQTKIGDQYWAGEAAAALCRKLQRNHPEVFIYAGITHTLPAVLLIRADERLDVPKTFRGYQVNFEVRNDGNIEG